ncbi:hypothetical protein ABFS83_07G047600 [Erythranthe nasuta]
MENNNKENVKLVGFWVSPFVQRVRWALKMKGIKKYEYIEEDIYNKSSLLSEINPVYGKVPVLVHNGKPLSESSIILEYIDHVWNDDFVPPLLPRDPYQRAQARFWAKFADQKVLESAWMVLCSEGEKQERAVKEAIEALEKLEEKLKSGNSVFFGGDTIGYLDLMVGFVSYLYPVWEEAASVKILDALKFPALAAWQSDFLNHELIASEYLPPKAEAVAYFRWRRSELIPVYNRMY